MRKTNVSQAANAAIENAWAGQYNCVGGNPCGAPRCDGSYPYPACGAYSWCNGGGGCSCGGNNCFSCCDGVTTPGCVRMQPTDKMYLTFDAGETWEAVSLTSLLDRSVSLTDACYDGADTLWFLDGGHKLVKYTDPRLHPAVSQPVKIAGKQVTLWGDVKRSALLPNYPNPFNPKTWIPFELVQEGDVTIRVYDMQGHQVRELALGKKRAGAYLDKQHAAYWDGCDTTGTPVPSGVYFGTLTAGNDTTPRKTFLRKLVIRK